LIEHNGLHDVEYVEPYAGGAAIALGLLFHEHAATVHLNDLSRPIYAFWHTALNDSAWLCKRLAAIKVNMKEWKRQLSWFSVIWKNRPVELASNGGTR
jgi:DNA adenine methylase